MSVHPAKKRRALKMDGKETVEEPVAPEEPLEEPEEEETVEEPVAPEEPLEEPEEEETEEEPEEE